MKKRLFLGIAVAAFVSLVSILVFNSTGVEGTSEPVAQEFTDKKSEQIASKQVVNEPTKQIDPKEENLKMRALEKEKQKAKEEQKKKEEEKRKEKEKKKKEAEEKQKEEEKKKAEAEAEKKAKELGSKYNGKTFYSKLDLNMRSSAGVNSNVVSVLSTNTKAKHIGKSIKVGDSTWHNIEANGKKGWVNSYYLSENPVKVQKETKANSNQGQSTTNGKSQSSKSNSNTSNSNANQGTTYKPNHIYFQGRSVPYKNGGQGQGQAIIDGGVYASTWGGASTFSGTDGMNTHFIGHNPGQFAGIHNSQKVVVTDSSGTAFEYVRTSGYVVDERGVRYDNGENKWDRIVGTGGGERIVIQSTKKHPSKWIVEMKFNRKLN